MNEMKPGERPDTIHITNLPCKWFSSKHDLAHGSDLPSEYIFRKVSVLSTHLGFDFSFFFKYEKVIHVCVCRFLSNLERFAVWTSLY